MLRNVMLGGTMVYSGHGNLAKQNQHEPGMSCRQVHRTISLAHWSVCFFLECPCLALACCVPLQLGTRCLGSRVDFFFFSLSLLVNILAVTTVHTPRAGPVAVIRRDVG